MIWLSIAAMGSCGFLVVFSGVRQNWNAFLGWLTAFNFAVIDLARMFTTRGLV